MDENTLILYFGSMGMAAMAFAISFFAFLYQKKINNKKQELQQINDLLKATELNATTRFLEGQTKEKNRMAAELHDNIGSKLAILKLQLNEKNRVNNINILNNSIEAILTDVRHVSHDLSKGMFTGKNLIQTLLSYLNDIEEHTPLQIQQHFHQLEKLHHDHLGKYLFNIVQELLHNTLKYAKAKNVNIEINYFPDDSTNLIYQDDGIGFLPANSKNSEGIGLTNIRRRVETFSGQFFLTSHPGKGMEVNIELPLK